MRFRHSLRVAKTAKHLAKLFKVDQEKAEMAGLLHDYARDLCRKEPLKHAALSAKLAAREFGVSDKAVLRAIASHTLGKPGMSRLEKIIFLADHIEEERKFAGVKRVRDLIYKKRNLDAAVAESSGLTIRYLLDRGVPIHEDTIRTRNYYLKRAKR